MENTLENEMLDAAISWCDSNGINVLEPEQLPHLVNSLYVTVCDAALDTAQPVQVNAMLVEALEAAEKLEHEALAALSEATYELKVGNTYTTATDTYKANNDLIHRLDKILNSQYRDRKRAALTAAQQAQPEPRPTEDALWGETLKDRDAYHQFADDLAAQIAAITGVDIGEHSSVNNPWQEAMLAADDFIATQLKTMLLQQTQPERAPSDDKLNADRYRWLREQHWSDSKFAVVSNPKAAVNLGSICPSRELLDEAIDAAIKQGGQQ